MQIRDTVRLESYDGLKKAPVGCNPEKNYWKLIGRTGEIVKDPFFCAKYPHKALRKERTVLVQFKRSFATIGLIGSDLMENSVWVPVSDLIVCD